MLVRCLGATHKVLGYSRYAFTGAAVRVGCCRSAARRCTAFRPAGCASCWAARARRGRAATTSCAARRGCPPRSSRCSWRSPPTRRGRCAARYLCACFRCGSVPCGTCLILDQARLSSKDLVSAPPASVACAMLICGACSRPWFTACEWLHQHGPGGREPHHHRGLHLPAGAAAARHGGAAAASGGGRDGGSGSLAARARLQHPAPGLH